MSTEGTAAPTASPTAGPRTGERFGYFGRIDLQLSTIITIASGLAKFNLAVFLVASIVTRGLRFFLVAGLLRQFGTPIRTFIEQRLTLVTTGFAAMIVLGFAVLRYL